MKKIIYLALALVLAAALFWGCTKDINASQSALSLSTTEAKKLETIVLQLSGFSFSASAVTWSVTPTANAVLTDSGFKARVYFTTAGYYTVKATVRGMVNTVFEKSIHVSDSTYDTSHHPMDSVIQRPFSSQDVLNLMPIGLDSGGSKYLYFQVTSQVTYRCLASPFVNYTDVYQPGFPDSLKGTLRIQFIDVYAHQNCLATDTSRIRLSTRAFKLADSTQVSITFLGREYSGSVVSTLDSANKKMAVFKWNNASPVTINPQFINY